MIIKIEGKPYNFKYKLEEVTLDDYLDIVDILNEDQYDYFIDQHTKEKIRRKEPRPKSERDESFIFDTYRKVIKRLSTIPLKYLKEDELITTLLNHLSPIFEEINKIQAEVDLESEDYPSFIIDGEEVFFEPIEQWSFYKWVTLETYMSKGLGEMTTDEDGNEIVKQIIQGNRYILPIVYGEFDEKLSNLENNFNFFNKNTSFITTYQIFIRILHLINKVKKLHSFIYGGESSGARNSPNLDKHNKDFGWLSTLIDLAEKGVFGTYKDVKNANLLEVLEYLNCSCSKSSAEANDATLKQK